MAAIYSNGGNRWNILDFNFTIRDALSSEYKISMGKMDNRLATSLWRFWLCSLHQVSKIENFNPILGAAAPNISSLGNALQYNARKLDVTCISTGVPRPVVLWLLNGRSLVANESSIKVDTTLEIDENIPGAYRVISRLVITDRQYPLRIQCVARNDVGELHSENIYVCFGAGT